VDVRPTSVENNERGVKRVIPRAGRRESIDAELILWPRMKSGGVRRMNIDSTVERTTGRVVENRRSAEGLYDRTIPEWVTARVGTTHIIQNQRRRHPRRENGGGGEPVGPGVVGVG